MYNKPNEGLLAGTYYTHTSNTHITITFRVGIETTLYFNLFSV